MRPLARHFGASGVIADIPVFPGLAPDGRITTLGRGGSDTSAVAVAAAERTPVARLRAVEEPVGETFGRSPPVMRAPPSANGSRPENGCT